MSEKTAKKTTGKTPIAINDDSRKIKSVHNLLSVKTVLVDYTDGFGKTAVKLAFILGKEVRFLESPLSRPVQSWLADEIREKLDD